jgi:hypothetical protein
LDHQQENALRSSRLASTAFSVQVSSNKPTQREKANFEHVVGQSVYEQMEQILTKQPLYFK